MGSVTEHKDFLDLLPLYALGCLEEEEKSATRDHLVLCAECREELSSLRSLVGGLAATVPAVAPPPGLEERILAASRLAPAATPRPHGAQALRADQNGRGGPAGSSGRAGNSSRARRPILAIAAVAALLILGAGNLLQWRSARSSSAPGGSPGLETLALAGTGPGTGAFGTVVLDADDNEGVLAVRGLAALDPSRRYQLWLLKGEKRMSGGSFSVDARGYGSLILDVPPDFRGFEAFRVTEESAGGSAEPTGVAVMEGRR